MFQLEKMEIQYQKEYEAAVLPKESDLEPDERAVLLKEAQIDDYGHREPTEYFRKEAEKSPDPAGNH